MENPPVRSRSRPDSPTSAHHRKHWGDAPYTAFREPFEKAAEAFDAGFRGDDGALVPAILWGVLAAFIWFLAWLVRVFLTRDEGDVRWRRRFWVWMAFLPIFAIPLWFSFFYIDRFLPSF